MTTIERKRMGRRALLYVGLATILAVCVWMTAGLAGCAQAQRIDEANAVLADPDATPEEKAAAQDDLEAAGAEVDTITTSAGGAGTLIIPAPFNLFAPIIAGVIGVIVKGKE